MLQLPQEWEAEPGFYLEISWLLESSITRQENITGSLVPQKNLIWIPTAGAGVNNSPVTAGQSAAFRNKS